MLDDSGYSEQPMAALSADGLVVRNPAWLGADGLIHGVTTRAALPWAGKADLFEVVERAREAGALPARMTYGGDQTHEDRVAALARPVTQPGEGYRYNMALPAVEFLATDAFATSLSGCLLAIQTADCLPVFLVDFERGIAGLAHCGWRGLRAGLAPKTVDAMRGLGAMPAAMQAWLGPCIRVERYEVGPALTADFAAAFPGAPVSPDGTHLDLAAIARWQLERAGLAPERVFDSGECTRRQSERYHSYRAQGPDAGRLLSFIGFD